MPDPYLPGRTRMPFDIPQPPVMPGQGAGPPLAIPPPSSAAGPPMGGAQAAPLPPPAGAEPPGSGMGSMGGIDRQALAMLIAQLSMQNPNANAGFNAGAMPPQGSFNPEPTGLGGNPPRY